MDVILNGACGRMGVVIREKLASEPRGIRLAVGVDPTANEGENGILRSLSEYSGYADVIIDFSNHKSAYELMEYAVSRGLPCVVATTGHTDEERAAIERAAEKIPVFMSANMSLGVAVTARLAKLAASLLPEPEVEIVETHHDKKLDAPSGTALILARSVKESLPEAEFVCGRSGPGARTKNEIGIHSLRIGGVVGEHEVIISSGDEMISIKHTAASRSLFADGALAAAEFLMGKPAGLYDMNDVVKDAFGD